MSQPSAGKTSTISKLQARAEQLSRQQWIMLGRTVWHNFNEDNCTQMAAAISYFAMLSIFPLLLLTITLLPSIINIFNPHINVTSSVLLLVSNSISPDVSAWLATILPELSKNNTVLNWIGLPSLILSASGVFGQLDYSFSRIWRLKEDARLNSGFRAAIIGLLRGRFNSLWVLILVAAIFLINLFITNSLSQVRRSGGPSIINGQTLNFALSILLQLFLGFIAYSLLYRYMAPRPVPWRAVFFSAILVSIANEFVRVIVAYVVNGIVGAEYQGIAGPLALMLWVFFTSQNILIGCELARHYYMIFYRQSRFSGTTLDS